MANIFCAPSTPDWSLKVVKLEGLSLIWYYLDCRYSVHAEFEDGFQFMAFTYAGEIPSCAFGFNSHGVVSFLLSHPQSFPEYLRFSWSGENTDSIMFVPYNLTFSSNELLTSNLISGTGWWTLMIICTSSVHQQHSSALWWSVWFTLPFSILRPFVPYCIGFHFECCTVGSWRSLLRRHLS